MPLALHFRTMFLARLGRLETEVTLTVVALLPWQCISNPNGSYAMQTQPGVLCFSSEEHTLLLGLSVLGLLMRLGARPKRSCLVLGILCLCSQCRSGQQTLASDIMQLWLYT